MKCPKCGFISFDYLDNCKNCGKEMSGTKMKLNLPSFVPMADSADEFPMGLGTDTAKTQEISDTPTTEVVETEQLSSISQAPEFESEKPSVIPELILEEEMEESFEEEETGIELEMPGISMDDETSIDLMDKDTDDVELSEEYFELSSLEDELSTEESDSPTQPEEDVVSISLDPSDMEIIESDEEEPSSKEKE